MKTPRFITFTGADEHTSVEEMAALSRAYPIEWGILFSNKHQGSGRYPPIAFVEKVARRNGLTISAHLCGDYARAVVWSDRPSSIGGVKYAMAGVVHWGFRRAQINTRETGIDTEAIARWARYAHVEPILQCRTIFPDDTSVSWLFDKSGGNGILPERWPPQHPRMTCGYAGGINPTNVRDVVASIAATDYWIDMESGVRDDDDRFSLAKCRQVCEAVYG